MSIAVVDDLMGVSSCDTRFTCVSILAHLIRRNSLDLLNSAHMGSLAPRFHDNRFETNLVVMDRSCITSPVVQRYAPLQHHPQHERLSQRLPDRYVKQIQFSFHLLV